MEKRAKKGGDEVLPQDLVIEILLRVPARTVIRFLAVSKQWRDVINQPHFRHLHFQRSPSDSSNHEAILYFTIQMLGDPSKDQQPFICMPRHGSNTHHVIKIYLHNRFSKCIEEYPGWSTGSMFLPSTTCNGLLCITPVCRYEGRPIMVCNPLTLEYVVLPPCTHADTGIRSCMAGLGFAPSSREYKVVCIATTSSNNEPRAPSMYRAIQVCTLGRSHAWREVYKDLNFYPHPQKTSMLYVVGAIYWVIYWERPCRFSILSFHVESEKASVAVDNVPCLTHCYQNNFRLVRLGDCILSIFVDHGASIEVWVLDERYAWELRHPIELPHDMWIGKLLGVKELDDATILIVHEGIVMVYDGMVTSIGEGPDLSVYKRLMCRCLCIGYEPSLVSLKNCDGVQTGKIFHDTNRELLRPPKIQLPPKPIIGCEL